MLDLTLNEARDVTLGKEGFVYVVTSGDTGSGKGSLLKLAQ